MKQIILGTAGHIDHGKTSLIKAVTGINTDRLKEEQARGITIELGFAHLDLPGGVRLGIVDVPGHERFVKNMVAGATGIDIVAMIIAADEGVMPQTVEHMEICNLLGVRHGLVVITKIDLVDDEWLELVVEDIAEFVEGTFLENKPVIQVSSATGRGVPEFISSLETLSSDIPGRSATGLFRLPVDRVFTMKGFGTVITGTLVSGQVHVGDTVMIYPSRMKSKVRGLQVHNQSVDTAMAGMRTAINFQGLEKTSIDRGNVISLPDALVPSYMLDVSMEYLKTNKRPLKNRTKVRFHTGTSEVLGMVALLDREEVQPGEKIIAQVRFDSPVAVIKDDRFVIRSYSPVRTIGGGVVINPIPKKHKRFKNDVVEALVNLVDYEPDELLTYHIEQAGYPGISFSDLKLMANMTDKPLQSILQGLSSSQTIVRFDKEAQRFIHSRNLEKLKNKTIEYLKTYHQANPLKQGMPKEELKSKFPMILPPKLINVLLQQMTREEKIAVEEKTVRLSTHSVSLATSHTDEKNKILDTYRSSGLTPPYFKDVIKNLSVDAGRARDVLSLLIEEGQIVKAKEEIYFYKPDIENLKARLVDFLREKGEMTPAQFKEMTGLSRKYLIPLLEYFDGTNVTIRVGDVRKLRSR